MRLINVNTFKFTEFLDENIPKYAILSHTWGANELTFKDFQGQNGYQGGFFKLDGLCRVAREQGFEWVWIDTCCIDKSSSAELSEAINSMYNWYKSAAVCYVYLEDVPHGDAIYDNDSKFRKSRWFTRGWTLQELLAPNNIEFYDGGWMTIQENGYDVYYFRHLLSHITGIAVVFLCNDNNSDRSVATILSWAARRQTTRKEDRAYSLLGLLGVNMTPMYGEGDKAFIRLQEEIIRTSDDQSIFAWGYGMPARSYGGLLAPSPDDFAGCGLIGPMSRAGDPPYQMTNKGLSLEARLTELNPSLQMPFYALLDVNYRVDTQLAIPLCRLGHLVVRPPYVVPQLVSRAMFSHSPNSICISINEAARTNLEYQWSTFGSFHHLVRINLDLRKSDILYTSLLFDEDTLDNSLEIYPACFRCCYMKKHEGTYIFFLFSRNADFRTKEEFVIAVRFKTCAAVDDFALKARLVCYDGREYSPTVEMLLMKIHKSQSLFEKLVVLNDEAWSPELEWNGMKLVGGNGDGGRNITIIHRR